MWCTFRYVLYYEQNDAGEMVCARKARVDPNPITAFDISPSGSLVGFGTSEGAILLSCEYTPVIGVVVQSCSLNPA